MSSLSLSNSILKKAVSLSWPRLVEKDHRDSLYMELCLEIIDFHRGAIAASVQSRKNKDQVLDAPQPELGAPCPRRSSMKY